MIANIERTVQVTRPFPRGTTDYPLWRPARSRCRGRDLGLVTISIGGNDAAFANVLERCALTRHCQSRPFEGASTLEKWADQRLPVIQNDLYRLYEHLRSAAPKARVVVLGYPHLFPVVSEGGVDCDVGLSAAFGEDERKAINSLGDRLNLLSFRAAQGASVNFVDSTETFWGHEACGALGAWIRFVNVGRLSRHEYRAPGSFHPTLAGQRAFARDIACYLARYPDEPPEARWSLFLEARLPCGIRPRAGLSVRLQLRGDCLRPRMTRSSAHAPQAAGRLLRWPSPP